MRRSFAYLIFGLGMMGCSPTTGSKVDNNGGQSGGGHGGGGAAAGGASGMGGGGAGGHGAGGSSGGAAGGSGGASGVAGMGGQGGTSGNGGVGANGGAGAGGAGTGGAAGGQDGGASGAGAVGGSGGGSNPLTEGWTLTPFTFAIHSPYDLPESDRHSFEPATDTHTFWILNGDSPHQPPPNTTGARSELRMRNDYTSGDHQFEADFYVMSGSVGPTIMQVFGGSISATGAMFKVHADGVLKHYDNEIIRSDIYDKWLHLNVIHNALAAGTGQVRIYIDNALAGTFEDHGPGTHYFKCGVYNITSDRAESRFRNIKYWVR